MAEPVRAGCEMRTALPATLQAAEAFFVEFRHSSEALMDRVNRFAAELLVLVGIPEGKWANLPAHPLDLLR